MTSPCVKCFQCNVTLTWVNLGYCKTSAPFLQLHFYVMHSVGINVYTFFYHVYICTVNLMLHFLLCLMICPFYIVKQLYLCYVPNIHFPKQDNRVSYLIDNRKFWFWLTDAAFLPTQDGMRNHPFKAFQCALSQTLMHWSFKHINFILTNSRLGLHTPLVYINAIRFSRNCYFSFTNIYPEVVSTQLHVLEREKNKYIQVSLLLLEKKKLKWQKLQLDIEKRCTLCTFSSKSIILILIAFSVF